MKIIRKVKFNRRFVTVGATFFLAAATGHIMQTGETIGARLKGSTDVSASSEMSVRASLPAPMAPRSAEVVSASLMPTLAPPKSDTAPVAVALAEMPTLPALPTIEPAALSAYTTLPVRVAEAQGAATAKMVDAKTYDDFGLACVDGDLTVSAAPSAMLNVTLTAPCHPGARVTVRHGDLAFTMMTDAKGALSVDIPALSETARVEVRFDGGDTIDGIATVSDLASVTRTVLQWDGTSDRHLNAYEYASAYGGAGHVHAGMPRDPSTTLGGYLTVLGDATPEKPILAEVYTAPAGMTDVTLEVEATVTETNCNRDMSGQILHLADGKVTKAPLAISLPDCMAAGDLVLMPMNPTPVLTVAKADAAG